MPEPMKPNKLETYYVKALVDLPDNPTEDDVQKVFDDSDRSFSAWASKPVMDRYEEIIEAEAWVLDNFILNPVLLWSHDYDIPAVGIAQWVKALKQGLKFKPGLADSDFGRELYSLYKQRVLRAFSVGFKPLEWAYGDKPGEPSVRYTGADLLEISCVNVPACPPALVELMHGKGVQNKQLKDAIEWTMGKAGVYEPTKTFMEVTDVDDKALKELGERVEVLEKHYMIGSDIPLHDEADHDDAINLKELSKEELETLMASLQATYDNLYPNDPPADDDKGNEETIQEPDEMSDEELAALTDRLADDTEAGYPEVMSDEELDSLVDSLGTETGPAETPKSMTYKEFSRLRKGELI